MRQLLARLGTWRPSFRPPSKKQLVGGAVAAGLFLSGLLGLGPLVRQRVDEFAERNQLEVEIGRVWPALGGVSLRNVRVRRRASGEHDPWLAMKLARVDVQVGWGLQPRSLRVAGGQVTLTGEAPQVFERIRAWRRGHPSEPTGARVLPRALEVSVSGVDVSWPGALDMESAVAVVGLRLERASPVDERTDDVGQPFGLVGFERAQVSFREGSMTAWGADARFGRQHGEIIWTGARVAKLDADMSLAERAPASASGVHTGSIPAASVGGGSAWSPAPSAPPSSSTPDPVQRAARRLQQQTQELSGWAAEHLSSAGIFELSELTLSLRHGSESLHVGPGRVAMHPSSEGVDLSFIPGRGADNEGATLSVHAKLPRSGDLSAQVQGGPMTLASLGIQEGDFGLVDVKHAKLGAKMVLALRNEGSRFTFDGDGQVASLSVVHRALANDPVRGLDLGWSARGTYELDGSLLRLDDLRLALGAIVLQGSGQFAQGPDYAKVEARANVAPSDCQQMFSSLPKALVPKLVGTRMAGTVSLRTGLLLDTRRPDDMEVQWDLQNHCRIVEVPSEIDVKRFAEPFRQVVYDDHGKPFDITTGPGTPDWVPLHAMSPFLEAAITTTEDGGFRFHGGFDKGAIKNSIRDNLRAGRFLRGASTISMQLAKNLYLAREKNLSRKLQEAILTTYLEQSLSKDEILELYFNVVEFGPMLYGVGAAADHYFDTSSGDLSLGQALFLTSILPAPKRTYFTPSGLLSKGWQSYLHRLMRIMRTRNKINDDELLDGLSEVISYRVARSPRVRPSRDSGADFGANEWNTPDGP